MPGSVVRSVTVNFRAGGVGKYVADVETMGAATRQAFDGTSRSTREADRSLDGFDRTAKRTTADTDRLAASTRKAGQDADNSGRAFRRQGAEIDRTSGRMRVLTDAIITLGPALVPVGASVIPLLSGLTAGLGAAAGAAGVLVLATHGVGDALKALDAYQVKPSAANLAKLNETMAKLGPSGRQFVQYLDQIEPHLHNLQKLSEAGLLPGAESGIEHLMTLLPQVRQVVGSFSTEVGKELAAAGSHLSTDSEFQGFLRYLQTDGAPTMHAFAAATGDVIAGLTQLFVDMAPANRSFTQGLLEDAQAFRKWADQVGQTQGFRDFLTYIQTEGPRVMALLAGLGNALLGILKAAAPLGSAVLPVLTELLNILGEIGNSPIGPVIYTGVAAAIAFNRAGAAMDSLLKKLGFDTAALSGEMRGLAASTAAVGDASLTAGAGGAAGAARSAGGLKGLLNDLGVVGGAAALTSRARAGTGSAAEAAAAQARVRAVLGGGATGFSSRGALYSETLPSALALLIPSLASNLGNQLHPGAKIGGASASDLRKFGTYVNQATRGFQVSDLVSPIGKIPIIGNGADLRKAPRNALHNEDLTLTQMVGNGQGAEAAREYDAIKASAIKAGASVDSVQKSFKNYRTAAIEAGISTSQVVNAQRDSAQASLQQAAALKAATEAHAGAFDAETNYRQALIAAEDQAKKSNAGFKGYTAEVIANRQAVSTLAAAQRQQIEAMSANGASADQIKAKYASARRELIQTAIGMGASAGQARAYANQLLQIPKTVASTATANTASAEAAVAALQHKLDRLDGRTVTSYADVVQRVLPAKLGALDKALGKAGGGLLQGPGSGTSDSIPIWGSNGEYMIKAAAVRKYGVAMFDHINAMKLAGGGPVRSHASSGTDQTIYTLPFGSHVKWGAAEDYARAEKALDKVTLRIKDLTTKLNGADGNSGLAGALQDAQANYNSLSSSITSSLKRDLFSGTGGSAFGQANAAGSPGYAIAQLQGEQKDETDYGSLIQQVMAKGITGPALSEILASGGIAALRQFAAADVGTDQQYASLYASVRGPQGTLAAATTGALASSGATAQLAVISAQVDELTKQIATATKEQSKAKTHADKEKTDLMKSAPHAHAQAGKAVLDHAGQKAHRNTKRGPKRR